MATYSTCFFLKKEVTAKHLSKNQTNEKLKTRSTLVLRLIQLQTAVQTFFATPFCFVFSVFCFCLVFFVCMTRGITASACNMALTCE